MWIVWLVLAISFGALVLSFILFSMSATLKGEAEAEFGIARRREGMLIHHIVHESHDRAQRKGFVDSPIPERLALIHSEVSEALEDYRVGKMTTTIREDGKPEGFPSEMADVCIRCFDLAGQLGIDLEKEIRVKSDYNEGRSFKHGNKVC